MSISDLTEFYRNFYRRLLKSNMTLEERARCGKHVSSLLVNSKPGLWDSFKLQQGRFTSHLQLLSHYGFLPLKIKYASSIVEEVSSLPSSGIVNSSDGNRTETEYLQNVSALPSVKRLIHDVELHTLVSLYLGAPAFLYECEAWWQYPRGESHKPSNAQLWHRDRDDFDEVKLFFYASDVDSESGPHAFIPHSHNHSSLSLAFSDIKNPVVSGSTSLFIDDNEINKLGLLAKPKVWLGFRGGNTAVLPIGRARRGAEVGRLPVEAGPSCHIRKRVEWGLGGQ